MSRRIDRAFKLASVRGTTRYSRQSIGRSNLQGDQSPRLQKSITNRFQLGAEMMSPRISHVLPSARAC
jgi:hypothetical protein